MFFRILFLFFTPFLFSLPKGVNYEHIVLPGPVSIHLMEIDPEQIQIESCLGHDQGIGIEHISSMAERKGAFAAINGSFFQMKAPFEGISAGLLKYKGEIVFSSQKPKGAIRGAIGWIPGYKFTLIDRLHLHSVLQTSMGAFPIDSVNRPKNDAGAVLYTSLFHSSTLTDEGKQEYLIEDEMIIEQSKRGNSPIPENGFAFCTNEILPFRLPIQLQFDYEAVFHPERNFDWNQVPFIVSGTPVLIQDGRIVDFYEEKTLTSFLICPHPRTAIGIKENGNWLIAVVDGRSKVSKGMIIQDLAQFFLDRGCTTALNLDGGGSTALYLEGKILNKPCGSHEGEKGIEGTDLKVGDAILFFERK